ncbi:YihY/virulence factor BrkB family protein [Angustibacter sp. McL0619]|uniref:YihY/virulence factor BrkB family protein n=1 Tax=Angustibacter sp. McL0619 TaxID=3415676 RepID=UPI003CF35C31
MSSATSLAAGVWSRVGAVRRSRFALGLWALTRETVSVCMRYRVTGLAAEAGFFALLSLPPLILGLLGGVGYLGNALGPDTVTQVSNQMETYAERVFTAQTVSSQITPTIQDVLNRGRLDIISIAFALSLWSGSRVLNVFIDTISIMYGQGGRRGIIRTRALSFSLYTGAVLVGAILLPLVLLGPSLLSEMLPPNADFVLHLYWPAITLLTVASIATLFHLATPHRTSWRRDVPGAVLALVIWVVASVMVRKVIGASVGGSSIYGPLAATIIVLIWLYFLAIAVLIGAALNAASRELWPIKGESRSPLAKMERRRHPLTPIREPDDEMPGARRLLDLSRDDLADEIQATGPGDEDEEPEQAPRTEAADNQVTRPGQSA